MNEVERMKSAAAKIAATEIATFNAAEEQYKNEVQFSSIGTILPELDFGNGMFAKQYRHFTGYELKDIVKTDSIVAPYILVIDYQYDFLMTRPKDAKSARDTAAREAAAKETTFTAEVNHLVRRYHCDAKGNSVGKFNSLPPRENVYAHGGLPPETSVLQGAK